MLSLISYSKDIKAVICLPNISSESKFTKIANVWCHEECLMSHTTVKTSLQGNKSKTYEELYYSTFYLCESADLTTSCFTNQMKKT